MKNTQYWIKKDIEREERLEENRLKRYDKKHPYSDKYIPTKKDYRLASKISSAIIRLIFLGIISLICYMIFK